MQPDTNSILTQIDAVIAEAEAGLWMNHATQWYGRVEDEQAAMRSRIEAAIERLSPPGSVYPGQSRALARMPLDGAVVPRILGVLRALRADFAAGYLNTVEELVRADVFTDFLEMADELIGKGYKDAAAVIAGTVLEEHLRKLAVRHAVAMVQNGKPRKADAINADLAKAGAYNALGQKSVTAWLALRNDAAHGHYNNYDQAQVAALIRDLRGFMHRHGV